ncbi:MAG: hypothetical protein HYV09_26820 [Deltaproteobacteria bacterium]|nr:hypothetical protein [Deltaproteobacteria bacterium]
MRELQWLLDIPGLRSAIAGAIGGFCMAAYEMMATWAIGPGPLAPLALVGASHPDARAHPALVGFAMHLVTAAFWGTRLGGLAGAAPPATLRWPGGLAVGLLWGVGVWIVMGKIVAPLINPMIVKAPEPHFLVGHLVYGVVSVLVLETIMRRLPSGGPVARP